MVKLAEALILRADTQKRIQQLRERLVRSAKIQEGDQPPENPNELLAELDRTLAEFTSLVKRINRTNIQTTLEAGKTLTDALAERDTLSLEHHALVELINAAATAQFRYSRTELKYVSTLDVPALQKRSDDVARRHRQLDSRIQAMNWNVELLE